MSNPPPLDNTISNTALGVITCRKASAAAMAHTSAMYQRQKLNPNSNSTDLVPALNADQRGEVLEFEPVYCVLTTTGKPKTLLKGKNTELQVLSALNGINAATAKAVMKMIRFVGFSRGEANYEGMAGNVNGGLAIMVHGVLSVMNTGIREIHPGALVRMRAPTEEEAALQRITGYRAGKTYLMTEAYVPSLDPSDAKSMFTSLMGQLGQQLSPQLKLIADDMEDSSKAWWKAQRQLFAVFKATEAGEAEYTNTGGDVNAALRASQNAFFNSADMLGLFDESKVAFQAALLKRLFVMNTNGSVVDPDPSELFFSPSENTNEQQMFQFQSTAVVHSFDSIIGGHADKLSTVIGKTATGATKGGSMDLLFWANV